MAKADFVFILTQKGAEEIAESSVLRQVLKGDILGSLCTRGLASAWWRRGIICLRERERCTAGFHASQKSDIYSGMDMEPCGTSDAVLREISFTTFHLVCFLS